MALKVPELPERQAACKQDLALLCMSSPTHTVSEAYLRWGPVSACALRACDLLTSMIAVERLLQLDLHMR